MLGFKAFWLARILYNDLAETAFKDPSLALSFGRMSAIGRHVDMLGLLARIEWYSRYVELYDDTMAMLGL